MLLSLILAASVTSCPVADATYQVRNQPEVTARFRGVSKTENWPSGLALQVHVRPSGRSYWFLPWQGGTDQRTNMAWVKEKASPVEFQDARRDLLVINTDGNYNVLSEVPKSGDIAPSHFLMPDLGPVIYYSTTAEQRDSIARTFFDLISCGKADSTSQTPKIEFPPIP
jgi:hypothetical protein